MNNSANRPGSSVLMHASPLTCPPGFLLNLFPGSKFLLQLLYDFHGHLNEL